MLWFLMFNGLIGGVGKSGGKVGFGLSFFGVYDEYLGGVEVLELTFMARFANVCGLGDEVYFPSNSLAKATLPWLVF